MGNLVKRLGEVQVENVDVCSAVNELGDLVKVLQQIGYSGEMLEEPLLGQADQLVEIQVSHDMISDEALHYFGQDTCETNWTIV